MGLLKHAILPLFAALDLLFAYKCLIAEDMDDMRQTWGRDTPTNDMEMHIVHFVGGVMAAFFVNNVAAIVSVALHSRDICSINIHTTNSYFDSYTIAVRRERALPRDGSVPAHFGLRGGRAELRVAGAGYWPRFVCDCWLRNRGVGGACHGARTLHNGQERGGQIQEQLKDITCFYLCVWRCSTDNEQLRMVEQKRLGKSIRIIEKGAIVITYISLFVILFKYKQLSPLPFTEVHPLAEK